MIYKRKLKMSRLLQKDLDKVYAKTMYGSHYRSLVHQGRRHG